MKLILTHDRIHFEDFLKRELHLVEKNLKQVQAELDSLEAVRIPLKWEKALRENLKKILDDSD